MFPNDLNDLFPIPIGGKRERLWRDHNLNVTISCVDQGKYDLLVIDTTTKKTLLQGNGKQEDVMQENWKLFRDGGFKEMS